jgi:hypothetical protein
VDEVKELILKIGNKRALDSESHRGGEEKTRRLIAHKFKAVGAVKSAE